MKTKRKRLTRKTCTPDQLRCWNALSWVVGGDHHFDGPVYECGKGIAVSHFGGVDTFDGDEMTRLVLVAHADLVRISVVNGGPQQVKLEAHPRKESGSLYERHPSLDDLIAAAVKIGKHDHPLQAIAQRLSEHLGRTVETADVVAAVDELIKELTRERRRRRHDEHESFWERD